MENFNSRLLSLLMKENISNAELARKIDMSAGRISDYLNNVGIARINNVLKFVNFFHCSVDYILGVKNEYVFVDYERVYNKDKFVKRFQDLLKAKHIGYNEFCRRVGISLSCAYKWRKGQVPDINIIQKIARNLQVSTDYLLDL